MERSRGGLGWGGGFLGCGGWVVVVVVGACVVGVWRLKLVWREPRGE